MHRDKASTRTSTRTSRTTSPKTELFHANPVFTFGGPVLLPKYNGRNKTFFFYNYEFLKSAIPTARMCSVRRPISSSRAISRSRSTASPAATSSIRSPVRRSRGTASRRATAARTAAANQLSRSDFRGVRAYMVRPNAAPDAQGNNFIASPNSRADIYNSHLLRIDHNFGEVRSSRALATTADTKIAPTTAARTSR